MGTGFEMGQILWDRISQCEMACMEVFNSVDSIRDIESVFLHQQILSATLVAHMNLGSALDLVGFNLFNNFMDP